MSATRPLAVALAVLAVALAGCTGGFTVNQTEPIRVQIEGAPQTVVVREGGEAQEVNVETCPEDRDPCDVENVDVQLRVHKVSTEACSVKVTIRTVSGEVLDEVIIDVDGVDADDGATTGDGNATGNGTMTATATQTGDAASGDTVVQNIIVNVKGNKNIVVVSQALEGSAEVNVQAIKASGNADVDADQDGSDDATSSDTMTATNSTTTTTTGA
jgi:hypothetical protein